ncbi:hypothetical protein [Piscinibacter sp. XHJ-5]|uniref:hypothetical protein n=1 Tax=Piscinibacter sp. XHJ-5 TaxID=3037797 RepID=UPI0024534944|nr:hypothetical protein [Piscinibacter sp. XHJ-5]
MNATPSKAIPDRLAVVVTLAHVLEQLEASRTSVGADQYRSVVRRLADELASVPADSALRAVLDAHPAASQLYENLNYRHAGLCRSPLEHALGAELRAKEAIERARRR